MGLAGGQRRPITPAMEGSDFRDGAVLSCPLHRRHCAVMDLGPPVLVRGGAGVHATNFFILVDEWPALAGKGYYRIRWIMKQLNGAHKREFLTYLKPRYLGLGPKKSSILCVQPASPTPAAASCSETPLSLTPIQPVFATRNLVVLELALMGAAGFFKCRGCLDAGSSLFEEASFALLRAAARLTLDRRLSCEVCLTSAIGVAVVAVVAAADEGASSVGKSLVAGVAVMAVMDGRVGFVGK